MAAMDSRLVEYTKEITGLKKALNRSDEHIAELEAKLQARSDTGKLAFHHNTGFRPGAADESSLLMDDSEVQPSREVTSRHLSAVAAGDDTFQLELPSPADSPVNGKKIGMASAVYDASGFSVDESMEVTGKEALNDDTVNGGDESLEVPSPPQLHKVSKKLRFNGDDASLKTKASASVASLPPELSTVLPRTQQAMLSLSREQLLLNDADVRAQRPAASSMSSSASYSNNIAVHRSSALYGPDEARALSVTSHARGAPTTTISLNQSSASPDDLDDDCMKLFEQAEARDRHTTTTAVAGSATSSRPHLGTALYPQSSVSAQLTFNSGIGFHTAATSAGSLRTVDFYRKSVSDLDLRSTSSNSSRQFYPTAQSYASASASYAAPSISGVSGVYSQRPYGDYAVTMSSDRDVLPNSTRAAPAAYMPSGTSERSNALPF